MAKVLITEDYLSDIADAIREKKSSQDTYTPAEMADAIESIQTGITPTGTKSVTITSNGTTTEDVTNYASAEITVNVPSSSPTLTTKTITENGTYAASSDNADGYSSVTVNVPSTGYEASDWMDMNKPTGEVVYTSAFNQNSSGTYYALYKRKGVTKCSFPNATAIGDSVLRECSVSELYIPNVTYLYNNSLRGSGLVYLVAPKWNRARQDACNGCTSLLAADLGNSSQASVGNGFEQGTIFSGCTNLATLVLRNPSGVVPLNGTTVFNSTPFASGGAGGTLYVPEALVSSYEADSKWSVILGYTNNQIKSIESTHTDPNADLDLTTHYIDGSLIPT